MAELGVIIITIKTFKRYEMKYFLDEKQYQTVTSALEGHMVLDKYCQKNGTYMIYNLYFDTENDDIISKSIEKPYYKEKLRMRSYHVPVKDDDIVYLELKKKIGGIVAKRRATMTYSEAMEFINDGKKPEFDNYNDSQVVDEISDFLARYPSKPKVYISYERVAYFDQNDMDFRISFDTRILTRRNNIDFYDSDYGTALIPEKKYIMEIKLSKAMPLWMCDILSKNKIYKTSFSKYGTEFKKYKENQKRSNHIRNSSSEIPDSIVSNGIPFAIITNKGANKYAR